MHHHSFGGKAPKFSFCHRLVHASQLAEISLWRIGPVAFGTIENLIPYLRSKCLLATNIVGNYQLHRLLASCKVEGTEHYPEEKPTRLIQSASN